MKKHKAMTKKTIEEKRALFLDMQEHPGNYSDSQFEKMLADEDMQKMFKDMATAKRAVVKASLKKVDVDAEWNRFAARHGVHSRRGWLKVAASVGGVVFLSGVALAAAIQFGVVSNPFQAKEKQVTAGEVKKAVADSVDSVKVLKEDSVALRPVEYDNVALEKIVTDLAAYYKRRVVFRNAGAKKVRLYFKWDKSKGLEKNIGLLNGFDRINISLDAETITVE